MAGIHPTNALPKYCMQAPVSVFIINFAFPLGMEAVAKGLQQVQLQMPCCSPPSAAAVFFPTLHWDPWSGRWEGHWPPNRHHCCWCCSSKLHLGIQKMKDQRMVQTTKQCQCRPAGGSTRVEHTGEWNTYAYSHTHTLADEQIHRHRKCYMLCFCFSRSCWINKQNHDRQYCISEQNYCTNYWISKQNVIRHKRKMNMHAV